LRDEFCCITLPPLLCLHCSITHLRAALCSRARALSLYFSLLFSLALRYLIS
jgi:hypothetical protein